MLCKLNHDALKEVYGPSLVLFELPRSRWDGLKTAIDALRGHIDGLDEVLITRALQIIRTQHISHVFVDGSNLGGVVEAIKNSQPQVQVCTFFHNVEARFFWGSFRQIKTLHALAVLIFNYMAERKSVRYSDKRICLSERDSGLLLRLYWRAATHVSPIALQDKLPAGIQHAQSATREKFALFVGGVFYANRAGITWFVNH
jgi:hypothetical protein